MGVLNKVGKTIGFLFDFRIDRWLDLRNLKETTSHIIHQTKVLLTVEYPKRTESFDDATERLELTSDFIKDQSKRYLYLAGFFILMATLILTYGIIIFLQSNYMGALICLALVVYTLSRAFRFHFWYFQIKEKKLGCSLKDWLKFIQLR